MEGLERNAPLRGAIREAIEAGLPTYAECGGLIYLSRSLRWGGRRCDMVGAIPADTVMHERPQGRGYVRLQPTGLAPWTAAAQDEIRAHEFHYSSLVDVDPTLEYAYEVKRGAGVDGRRDGIVYKNLIASYAHLRDTAHTPWARRFVEYVRAHRPDRTAAGDPAQAALETTPSTRSLPGVSTR
jgi:cobyrinic acid a,c-diamide synthase